MHRTTLAALALCMTQLGGCKSSPANAPAAPVSPPRPAHSAHSSQPPIDCPLRKAGIDPGSLKPFEETQKYIDFLERPDRATWQKPDEVVAALGLTGTETVADVGAGSGYFSSRLARVVPKGRVVAIDVEPEMIRHIHHKSMEEQFTNVDAVLAPLDDPSIPRESDLVLICDVLHHVEAREAWLAKAFRELKPGSRLALIEFKEGTLPEGPPERMKIPRSGLLRLMQDAGFVLQSERPDLLPYQTFLVFARPDREAQMKEITYRPIGVVHSEFVKQEGTPIQSVFAGNAKGYIELDPAYAPALKDLEGMERIWVLYHLDRAAPYQPLVVPYLDDSKHGLFATRSPPRPNPIGISVLRLIAVKGNRLEVEGMDILDGTPLLDIKPYVPQFDAVEASRAGWFDHAKKKDHAADARFDSNR